MMNVTDDAQTTRRAALIYGLGPVLLSACGGGSSEGSPPVAADPPVAPPPVVDPPEAAAVIAQSPANATAVAGGTAAFTVEVNNSKGAAYQWLRNGAEIAGATASSLTYGPVSLLESEALFSVRVSTAAGSVTSQAATLTVTSPALTLIAGSLPQQGPVVFPIPAEIDGAGPSATFANTIPAAVAVDDAGNLYIASMSPGPSSTGTRSSIRKVAVDGTVTTFAGVKGESASADGVGSSARFVDIAALSFDRTRKLLLVLDHTRQSELILRIREVTLNAVVTTQQALSPTPQFHVGPADVGVAWLPDRTAYIAGGNYYRQSLTSFVEPTAVFKLPWGGAPGLLVGDPEVQAYDDGVGTNARFVAVGTFAADAADNIYVLDVSRLRRITPDGTVKTIAGAVEQSPTSVDGQGAAARFRWPASPVVEDSGNILVVDDNLIRRVTPDGRVITIARILPLGNYVLARGGGMLYVIGSSWVGRFDPFPA